MRVNNPHEYPPEPEYYEIEDYELGKCANCQRTMDISGVVLIHIALCTDCSDMILGYERDNTHTNH